MAVPLSENADPPEHFAAPRAGPRRSRRRRALVVVLLLAGVLIAAGAVGLALSGGGKSVSKAQPAVLGTGTATVERRDLVATDTEPGTLGYADERSVVNRLTGTITYLPAEGALVHPGHRLYAVDGKPVLLMDGGIPAYRDLSINSSDGGDVQELERNLVALGFDPNRAIVVDDHFDIATTAAVERLQAHWGLPQTGMVELGRVVFLPGCAGSARSPRRWARARARAAQADSPGEAAGAQARRARRLRARRSRRRRPPTIRAAPRR